MSLLDIFNTDAGRQALGLMAAGGPVTDPNQTGYGQRMQSAVGSFDAWKQRKQKTALDEMMLEDMQMKMAAAKQQASDSQAMRSAAQESYRSPDMANAMSMGPSMDGGAVPPVQSGFDQRAYLGKLFGINPMEAIKYENSLQKDNPFGKIDPKDYTQASIAAFSATRNPADLVASRKKDVVNNQAVDLHNTPEGRIFDNINPNQPFNLVGGKPSANTAFQQYEVGKARAGASSVSVNTGQKGLDNEMKFSAAFKGEPIYKAHQEVQSAHSQITQALKLQSPAGDLAGATKMMKILDPGSVVRESELGMAMAASGAMDRLTNYSDRILKGTKLTPTQRKDFQNLANNLHDESVKQYNGKRTEYHGFAGKYGLDSDILLGKPAAGAPTPASNPLPDNASAKNLTKGTSYELPNGQVGVWDGMRFKGQ